MKWIIKSWLKLKIVIIYTCYIFCGSYPVTDTGTPGAITLCLHTHWHPWREGTFTYTHTHTDTHTRRHTGTHVVSGRRGP